MLTDKEYAALLRREEELESKRIKLKKVAEQHRSESEQESDLDEAQAIRTEMEQIKTQKAGYTAPKGEENRAMGVLLNNSADEVRALDKKMVRIAFAKMMRNEKPTETETRMYQRALANPSVANGQSATTTSTEFIAVTEGSIGINNGGLFIPETVLLDILRDETLDSPILNDVMTTAIRGMVNYPYLVQKTPAKNKAELDQTDSKNIEWAILAGKTGNLTTSIIVTFEALAQTIEEFVPYLMELIRDSMRELLLYDYIYGNGENDSVLGITYKAISGDYAADTKIQTILETAVKKIPVRKRNGAVIYLATDLHDQIIFAKDSNGDYIRPVFSGVSNDVFGVYRFAHDPALKEGEFIIGNIRKWYKANMIKPMELGLDVSNKKRINEYTAHLMVNAIPVTNSFVHGKKSS